MARELGMLVVAEGVETAAHCEFLRQRKCDAIQGYFFSKPLPAADISRLLGDGKTLDGAAGARHVTSRVSQLQPIGRGPRICAAKGDRNRR